MEYQILKLDVQTSVAIVTVSRPQALNALNSRFFAEMDEMIKDVSARNDIKVMIVTGEGKAFVAGADIAEMVDMNSEQGSNFSRIGQNTFRSIEKMPIMVLLLAEVVNLQCPVISELLLHLQNSVSLKSTSV